MIPVWINNRDRLSTTRALVEYLRQVPGCRPIIVDNASTYPPLLGWYGRCGVEVQRLAFNGGSQAPWRFADLARGAAYYAVTDSDLDLDGVPRDLLAVLRDGLNRFPEANKAGLSLEVHDLPDTPLADQARAWEAHFWEKRLDGRWFLADVDTTFALYRAGDGWGGNAGPAIRSDRPYTGRHVPWYLTPETMTEEERYYLEHCDRGQASWAGRIEKSLGERKGEREKGIGGEGETVSSPPLPRYLSPFLPHQAPSTRL